MAIEMTLELDFLTELNKTHRFRIYDAKDDLNRQDVLNAMDEIIESNIFSTSGGDLTSKKAARLVTREVIEYELT
ncbi:MAG: DUF2922 domain-containing protein [Syntrophomonadaceae bacterium]|nr:DUF2922 domain-containing protein [Syntrophomonadaceae bacterium]